MGPLDILAVFVGIFIALTFGLYLFIRFGSKGKVGEFIVKLCYRIVLPRRKFKLYNNIILEHDGRSSQIDHLIISQYGIYVIETKNYSGRIYGNETSEQFTQYIGKNKYSFYSPIKQNQGHIYALKKVIGDFDYTSHVVFLAGSILQVTSNTFVGTPLQSALTIRKNDVVAMSEIHLEAFIEKLENVIQNTTITERQHIANVAIAQVKAENALRAKVCPKCGSKLVLRKGNYGEFYGCSAYPKCKYIHKDK